MIVTEDRKELFKAISAAQGEFTTVEKNGKNPHFNSKFAPLDSIIEMVRPILPRHGLSAIQFTEIEPGGIVVETVISHDSGQYISGRLFMPAVKQDPQGYGSALTYGRRYALAAALGIVSDEDVDGNHGDGDKKKNDRKETGKEGGKSPAQGQNSAGDNTLTAQGKLLKELAISCQGDEKEMSFRLKGYTSYPVKDSNPPTDKWMTLDALRKPSDNEKFLKWCGSALSKLRKDAPATCPKCDGALQDGKCYDVNCEKFAG
jgi:hypothetical protein